ncbi:MAG: phospho-N-acetylmuramoyl-pentapeptide-transferase, partial [Arthrobacter sp.]|nr:phospho-N-acetylmuramoyl-pentapeptide-transferase [Arthrobacter sp.]
MIALLMGSGLALLFALVGTPLFIRLLVRKSYGQFIRDDGPTTHHTKRGTPTMGGTIVVLAVLASYGLTHLI